MRCIGDILLGVLRFVNSQRPTLKGNNDRKLRRELIPLI
jgi:hypothetical protein